jgi:mono/diheme cytochrome c family protein
MMGADYEYRLSAFNSVGSSSSVVLPVSIPSLLDYGKLQYQHQNCGSCHGTDGNGGIAGALTKHLASELTSLTATIAATMPPPATPAQCTGNCALGTARYILEVLVPASSGNGNSGGTTGASCSGNPPGHRSLRLLTRQEYQNTVNDLLGLSTNLIYQLPDENRVDGFDNNVATNLVTNLRLEAYLSQADTLASLAALQSWNKLLPCSQQNTACAQQFISSFGKRAYRRPLTATETADYLSNFSTKSFNDAVTTTVSQMLMSPYFLYRSELGELQADGSYKLTPYETASALSYLFLGSLPDDNLLNAADQNQLDTPEQRLTQAARLIGMSKSHQQVGNFVGQWLLSSSPYTLPEKDKTVYPRYTAEVKAGLSAELIDFFNYVTFESTQNFPELFTADYIVANKTLADYYGIAGSTNANFQATPVADGSRTGILTLGAVLSRYANSNESHPFKRGGFLYKRLLCHDLPLPANAGLIKAPQPDPNATTRERFDFHSKSNTSCYSCHQFLDAPGFGFENYDGAGIYRATENGQVISTGGIMRGMETFTPGEETPFADLRDLSSQIASSPRAAQCVARQYFRYTTGRREQTADSCALDSYIQTYARNGYNLHTMLLGIVNAPGFNLRSGTGQ